MDEIALVNDAQRGDLDAFNSLVLAYQDMVFGTACRILGDDEQAADATQEAFISAFRNISSYRGGSFKAWLLRIVTNACYDELRYRKRRPTVPLEPITDDDEEMDTPRWLADPSLSPEEQTEMVELDDVIQNCLNDLPDEFRAVVVLVDVQGMDYSDAAKIARTPLGTIKSRLARARLRLRECLQAVWELLPASLRLNDDPLAESRI